MKVFWNFSKRYILQYGWWYFLGFLFIVGTQWLGVGIIAKVKDAIDAVDAADATAATVLPFTYWIVAFALLLVVVRTASRLLIFTPGRMIEYHIRNDYYANLLYLDRDFLSKQESGDLVSRCSNDIGYIRAAYGFGFLQVANVSVTLVLVLAAMIRIDLRTTSFLAIPMAVSFTVIQISISYLFSYWRRANRQIGALSSLCLASYKGVAAIQNYHAEPAVESRFNGLNGQYLGTMETVTRVKSFMIPLVQMVGNLSIFTVLWFVGPKVIDNRLSLGEIMAFLGYISMIMPPLLSLGWMLNVFNQAVPAMERLGEILDARPQNPAVTGADTEKAPTSVGLAAKNLGFRFPAGKGETDPFALHNISFSLPPGKVLGVVGPLGSGKSALLDTLLRLNHPTPGQLFLNGRDVAGMDLNEYRAHFSFTPQRSLLFSTTLRNNLLVALPAEQWDQPDTEQRLLETLDYAGFHLDANQFPLGLETQVGQKGVMLSGGQRQRMALARSLLRKAEIFVFDDVLSAVDHETEKAIIANIRRFAAGKSFIVVSHRVSAVQWADEILVLRKGTVEARGSHETLINQPGFYREIYRYQSQHES